MDISVTDWLQGLGTAAGTIFAAFAAVAAFLLFRHEVRVRRADEMDSRAAQARSILVTFENPASNEQGHMATLPVALNNFSDGVIMDIRFAVRRNAGLRGGFALHMDFLGPQRDHSMEYDIAFATIPANADPTDFLETRVAFTDAHGIRWVRFDREQPVQMETGAVEISASAWARRDTM